MIAVIRSYISYARFEQVVEEVVGASLAGVVVAGGVVGGS